MQCILFLRETDNKQIYYGFTSTLYLLEGGVIVCPILIECEIRVLFHKRGICSHSYSYLVPLFIRFYLGVVIQQSKGGKLASIKCILCTKRCHCTRCSLSLSLSLIHIKCIYHLQYQHKVKIRLHKLFLLLSPFYTSRNRLGVIEELLGNTQLVNGGERL